MTHAERYGRQYARQMAIDGWGNDVQERLEKSRVCIIGVGGLGSPVSLYLAAAGVGTIVLCDYQKIERSNLNRQIIYCESDVGRSKAVCARERLLALNSTINIEIHDMQLDETSVRSVCESADLLIDCLDNFEARNILNRYSVAHSVPFIHAGIREFYGQIALLHPPHTPCLECFIPASAPMEPEDPPVLGATAGVVGSMQAAEAIKVLGGMKEAGFGVLRTVDLLTLSTDSIHLQRNPMCATCADAGEP
jgi:molybdopterin/thiamine biosynthesis adenylyltransferase